MTNPVKLNAEQDLDINALEQVWQSKINLASFYSSDKSDLNDQEKRFISPIYRSLIEPKTHYSKETFLAEGGEKRIYKVYDSAADRFVAMAKAPKSSLDSEKEHFLREARLTAALQHPNIISIYDMGIDSNNDVYFIMALLQGQTLKELINELKVSSSTSKYSRLELLQIFMKVCDAIAYAHSRKVVHLDLKPENISIGYFGDVTVFDWGLAQVIDRSCSSSEIKVDNELTLDAETLNDFTIKGKLKGTPGFMSPNQAEGGSATFSDDIYSLGVMLYIILVHELPLQTNCSDLKTIIDQTLKGNITPINEYDNKLPIGLCAVVHKALSLDSNDRYKAVTELRQDLQNYLDGFATAAENASFIKQIKLLIKRNQRLSLLMALFLILINLIIYTAFQKLDKEQKQTLNNFELYKKQVANTHKLSNEIRGIIHQSGWIQEVDTIQLMISKLDEALLLENSPQELKNLWQKKGEFHFSLEEFNQAYHCLEKSGDTALSQVAQRFGKIKPNDNILLTGNQLSLLFAQNTVQLGKMLYYKVFYFHTKRMKQIYPEHYVSAVKNLLDLLNNVSHEDVDALRFTIGDTFNHLSLQGTPYSNFMLPLPTDKSLNVLSVLNLNSIDISKSKVDDLEALLGLKLPYVQSVDHYFGYKIKVFSDLIGVKEITLNPKLFSKSDLAYFRTRFKIKEVASTEYFKRHK